MTEIRANQTSGETKTQTKQTANPQTCKQMNAKNNTKYKSLQYEFATEILRADKTCKAKQIPTHEQPESDETINCQGNKPTTSKNAHTIAHSEPQTHQMAEITMHMKTTVEMPTR